MSEERKYCPLRKIQTIADGEYCRKEVTEEFDYCIEKECAWWNSQENQCSIALIGDYIHYSFLDHDMKTG
ncbi:MAG: hypothetical protein H0Z35_13660 [Thermoanaerobacteraceae bacterium]|nr:hypothetical protein [Thermoanaerobacteraceae bacterium]MBO8170201.1 hypothetical protein [Thermoanaerobacteraceae bacterium]